MDHVTKKEFKEAIKGIDERFTGIDQRLDGMDRRIDDLASMVANGFADIIRRLDVRDRMEELEKRTTRIESALNMNQ